METQRLAIIDLDGTLLKGTSAERSFFVFLVRRARLGPARLVRFLVTFFCDTLRMGFRRAVGCNISYLRGQHAPLLLIHGTSDIIVPAWHSEAMFNQASAPKVILRVNKAGHNNAFYLQPGLFSMAMKDLLKRS